MFSKAKKYGRKAAYLKMQEAIANIQIDGEIKIVVDEAILPFYLGVIQQAKRSIFIAQYQAIYLVGKSHAMVNGIWHRLVQKHQEGIDVRILLNQNFVGGQGRIVKQQTADFLRRLQLPSKFFSKNKRGHAKFIIIDSEIVISGSHNLSERAIKNNFEVSLYLKNPAIAKQFENEFLSYWSTGEVIAPL